MKIREKIPQLLVHSSHYWYTKFFKSHRESWGIGKRELALYDASSIGGELHRFLECHQIELYPKLERHDIYHILTNYTLSSADEIRMQYFLFGNGKRSIYQLATMLAGTLILPEYLSSYIKSFRRGKSALPFYKWDFQHLLAENFAATQKLIFKKKSELKSFNHIHF